MKVTIITSCMNNGATIKDTIDSLNSQDYHNIDHIVKDGGSKDDTLNIIRSLRPSSRIMEGKDQGLFDALNLAMHHAKGEIVGILHADDLLYHKQVISLVVEKFKETNADAVYGDLLYVDRNHTDKVIRNWKSGEYHAGDFLKGWMPPHPALFVRKSVIDKWGGYRIEFGSAADYEWMLRLIHKHQINVAYLPEYLVAMRIGGQSNKSISNRLKANLQDRRAWTANGLKPKWYTLYLKPIRKLRQFF